LSFPNHLVLLLVMAYNLRIVYVCDCIEVHTLCNKYRSIFKTLQ
jgi:hypothetical protein